MGYPKYLVLSYLGLSRSVYYYKKSLDSEKKGRPLSQSTQKEDGTIVSNEQVVKDIITMQQEEFVDYGYLKTTHHLRQELGYIINPKKVYRLMKENNLLEINVVRKRGKRSWVTELVPQTDYFFHYLEFDIKYIWVSGKQRNAMVMTVIDVYSRWVLGQYINWQIDQYNVMDLFEEILRLYPLPTKVYVRNDNGSQMEATKVQQFFADKGITQEFTKPATPEQNAHIESYHSIVEKIICARYEMDDLEELKSIMSRWIQFYNKRRIHSGARYKSPLNFLLSKNYEEVNLPIVNLSHSKQIEFKTA